MQYLAITIVFPLVAHHHGVSAQYSDQTCYNTDCDLSADSLTNAMGVSIPQTCIDTGCGKRCYYTYIPECASNDSPLVYDIHGFSVCPVTNTYYTGWKEKADEECFVVVWPKGNVKAGKTSTPCWAIPGGLSGLGDAPETVTSGCCCLNESPILGIPQVVEPDDTQDLKFLRSIASYVVRDVPLQTDGSVTIDTKRIYMAGHSNGCMASLGMAMAHSDFVAAVCCHSGLLLTPPSDNYTPTPIWFVHGTDDEVLPYDGNSFEVFGNEVFFPSLQRGFDFLRDLNGCGSGVENKTIDGGDGFILKTMDDCNEGANVEMLTLWDVGHVPYSQTPSAIIDDVNFDTQYNTTSAAWEFCSNYQSAQEPELYPINESSLRGMLKSLLLKP